MNPSSVTTVTERWWAFVTCVGKLITLQDDKQNVKCFC